MRRLASALLLALVVVLAGCRDDVRPAPTPPPPTPDRPTVAWRWEAPAGMNVGAPAVLGDDVVVTAGRQRVVLLRRGRVRWTVDHVGVRDVAPLIDADADAVVVPTDAGLVALDRATGAVRWRTELGDRAATPVRAGGRLVTTLWDGGLVGLDPADGRVHWRVATTFLTLAPPTAAGSIAVAGSDTGLVAVDVADGRERWRTDLPSGTGAPAIVGDVVVVIAGDATARAVDVRTGTPRWTIPVNGPGSPDAAPTPGGDGDVVVVTATGSVARLDVRTGRTRWSTAGGVGAWRGGAVVGPRSTAVALGLDVVALLHPDRPPRVIDPPGGVTGIATTPKGELLVATANARGNPNALLAYHGW